MYLAGNLKFLREQIGKTQQELANLFGVEQKTMSSWECGSRTPGIEIIVELARYHGVSLDDLVLRDMKPAMPVYVLNLMYLRTSLQVLILSIIICVTAFFAYISYAKITFVWYYLVAVIFASFIVAIVCCKGWEYLITIWKRFYKPEDK